MKVKKIKKTIVVIVSILLILALLSLLAVIIFVHNPASNEELILFETVMPEYDNTFTFITAEMLETDESDSNSFALSEKTLNNCNTNLTELATEMYRVANENAAKMPSYASLIKFASTVTVNVLGKKIDVPVQGYRYKLKNGTEYYATEYSIPGSEGLGPVAGMFAKESSDFASRSYADVTKADYMYSEKSYSPTIELNDAGEPEIKYDFSEKNMVPTSKWAIEQPVPCYCIEQDDTFYASNRSMSPNNILSPSIEYIKSTGGNYYRIVLDLDVEKEESWERTMDELRQGTGPDAKYTKLHEIIEIWENGYYKSFRSIDHVVWKNGLMEMELDFKTYYYYDEEHCDPASYDNFTEVKEKALVYFKKK